jgi:hypothetical protein
MGVALSLATNPGQHTHHAHQPADGRILGRFFTGRQETCRGLVGRTCGFVGCPGSAMDSGFDGPRASSPGRGGLFADAEPFGGHLRTQGDHPV